LRPIFKDFPLNPNKNHHRLALAAVSSCHTEAALLGALLGRDARPGGLWSRSGAKAQLFSRHGSRQVLDAFFIRIRLPGFVAAVIVVKHVAASTGCCAGEFLGMNLSFSREN